MTARSMRHLGPLHYRAMALRLSGLTYAEIGREIHRSARTVQNWFVADETFRAAFEAVKAEQINLAANILLQAGPQAAQRLVELLGHRSGIVALGAAKDLLDRIGLKPTERHELTGKDGGPIVVDDAREALARRIARIAARLGAEGDSGDPDSTGSGSTPV